VGENVRGPSRGPVGTSVARKDGGKKLLHSKDLPVREGDTLEDIKRGAEGPFFRTKNGRGREALGN